MNKPTLNFLQTFIPYTLEEQLIESEAELSIATDHFAPVASTLSGGLD